MKFGVFISAQQPRSDDSVRRFREAVEQARLAHDAGFDALAAGHHYLSPPYQSLQSLPLLARLAGEAPGMDLCLSVLLLAMLNPVQTAEEVASLDIMSEGRVVFGVGIGYRDVEYEAFGMTARERVPRMLEALDLIKRLWTEEVVNFEGKFFRVHNATCTIRPVQKPYPPIWIAANADPAVVRTARLGLSWFVNPHAALPTIERQWERYKQALAEANHPMPVARPICLELHVAPTHEEAVETARPVPRSQIRRLCRMGPGQGVAGRGKFPGRLRRSGPRPLHPRHPRRGHRGDRGTGAPPPIQLPDLPDGLARHGVAQDPAGHRDDGNPGPAAFPRQIRPRLTRRQPSRRR